MAVELRTVRVRGWQITFVMKSKSGRIVINKDNGIERKSKAGVVEAFAKYRAKREAAGYTFEDVSEPHKFDEKREYLCF